jgi:hypothetical protein
MLREFAHLTEKLKDPEYLHLLLEPLMIWGLGIGVIAFLLAFFFGERKMQLVALAVIIISSLAVVPYLEQRAAADARVVKLRSDVKELIEESQERRHDSRGAYLLVASLAGLTALMGAHKGMVGMLAGIGTAVAGSIVVVHGAWLHLKDAEIYHPNIRVVEEGSPGGAGRRERAKKPKPAEVERESESEPETREVSSRPSPDAEGRRAVSARPR